jgi:iron complex outermembrane receptor protein
MLMPLVVVVAAAPAAADDKNQPRKDAAELARQSGIAYKRGDFERAVSLLREAYQKFPEPNLLYNLARALEGLGDKVGAIDNYQRYLDAAPKIEDRGAIERRIATLKGELEEARREAEASQHEKQPEPSPTRPPAPSPAPVTAPVSEPLVVEKAPPKEHSRGKLPWITIGTGAAILAAGGVMAYLSHDNKNKSEDAMSALDAQSFHDRAKRDALAANILFGVGGAVAVVGIVIAW